MGLGRSLVEEEHSWLSAVAPASLSLSSVSASHLAARSSRSDQEHKETSKQLMVLYRQIEGTSPLTL